jgi:hypothetical protein
MHVVFISDSILVGIFGMRDMLKYSLLAIVVQSIIDSDKRSAFRLLIVVAVTMGCTVLANLLLYPFRGDVFFKQYFSPEKGALSRSIGPFTIRRLESFLGSGASHIASISASTFGLFLGQFAVGYKNKWIYIFLGVSLSAVALTVSLSGLFGLYLVVLVISITSRKGGSLLLILVPALAALAVLLNVGLMEGVTKNALGMSDMNIASYAFYSFWKGTYGYFIETILSSPKILILGDGLGVVGDKGILGFDVGATHVLGSTDGGWAEMVFQVGILPFLGVITVIAYLYGRLLIVSFAGAMFWKNPVIPFIGALTGLLASIHMLPWVRIGSDVLFWVFLGASYALLSPARHAQGLRRF